ncbi:MAG TPA: WD40 repeat domain-containing protein [Anaerohalosphaeraceae bacterium]|nr:WD40 repeat domain-containing protein [Anaerohalosphaeraceae bacterium]HOL89388.1 WD40 repeat domain-containing protein [Anaerohalosphaeraceae bacterium]HPP54949.1 WD40 repeat domain-containing protein [Anaerohalosphaeraceae bacterium]
MAFLKNKIFHVLAVIVLVQVLILYLNYRRQDRIVLKIPNNQGIEELWTRDSHLIAAEMGRGFHIFDWSNLPAARRDLPAAFYPFILLPDERILSVKDKRGLVLENSPGRSLWLPLSGQPAEVLLVSDSACSTIILACQYLNDRSSEYRFQKVDLQQEILLNLAELQGGRDFLIRRLCVSDAQDKLILAGTKDSKAYLALLDIPGGRVVWEKIYPEEMEFYSVCFLDNPPLIFAGSRDGAVCRIDATDGQLLKTLPLVPLQTGQTKLRTIQRVVLSPDRKTLAASCDPSFYLIDVQTWQLQRKAGVSHKIISGVAFSPDGRYLATSDIRGSGIIEIFDLSK